MITFMSKLHWKLKKDTITWNQYSESDCIINYAAAKFYLFIANSYSVSVAYCSVASYSFGILKINFLSK